MTVLHPVAEKDKWRFERGREEAYPECAAPDFAVDDTLPEAPPALWVHPDL